MKRQGGGNLTRSKFYDFDIRLTMLTMLKKKEDGDMTIAIGYFTNYDLNLYIYNKIKIYLKRTNSSFRTIFPGTKVIRNKNCC